MGSVGGVGGVGEVGGTTYFSLLLKTYTSAKCIYFLSISMRTNCPLALRSK